MEIKLFRFSFKLFRMTLEGQTTDKKRQMKETLKVQKKYSSSSELFFLKKVFFQVCVNLIPKSNFFTNFRVFFHSLFYTVIRINWKYKIIQIRPSKWQGHWNGLTESFLGVYFLFQATRDCLHNQYMKFEKKYKSIRIPLYELSQCYGRLSIARAQKIKNSVWRKRNGLQAESKLNYYYRDVFYMSIEQNGNVDKLISDIGRFGPYQKVTCLLLFLIMVISVQSAINYDNNKFVRASVGKPGPHFRSNKTKCINFKWNHFFWC